MMNQGEEDSSQSSEGVTRKKFAGPVVTEHNRPALTDNEGFITQFPRPILFCNDPFPKEVSQEKELVTESDGNFIDKYLELYHEGTQLPSTVRKSSFRCITIEGSTNMLQAFCWIDIYLYAGAGLILKDLKDTYFQTLYEGCNERVSLVCKGSVETFYFNKQLKETLLENDENLKVHESILADIKRKFRKKRETGGNSDGNNI
uniref:Uncharacterized protein n=1 Tax=Strongyloides venezuelensis TaxID=75913 RepID=A0A0K0FZH1_STRVS